jgi:hypothetical protein
VAQTDGGDIIFTAGDGITKLDHEIEKYDPATGELVAWVEVRSVSSTNNTNIYIYYGNTSLAEGENQWNPVGVWDSNYVGVWHLKETPTVDPLAYDSTANDNDASFLADMTSDDQVDGRIDGALDFDASSNNDRVIASDNPSLGNMSDLTIETWVKLKEYPSTSSYFLSYKNHSADPWFSWQFMVTNWGDPFYLEVNGTPLTPLGGNYGSCASNTVPNTTDWYHVVGVYQNGQTPRIYVNGVDDTAWSNGTPPSGNIGDTDGDFSIGWNVKGMQDEFRISKVARSAAWIETEYNNQKAPAAFYTVGIEETSGTGADPFNNGWIYRKKITIDASKVPSDLTNFPVLINTTDPDLTAALANFNDILFTAGDGSTKLDHEIEKYNSSTGEIVAWVEVRSLSGTTNTDLYLYYGNGNCVDQRNPTGAGVWEPNYASVWHLKETSGDHADSTWNDNTGTPYGGLNQSGTGQMDGADLLDASDDYLEGPTTGFNTDAGTIDFWIKPNWNGNDIVERGLYIHQETDWDTNAIWVKKHSDDTLQFWVADDSATDYRAIYADVSGWVAGEWHHVTVSWDSALTLKMYLDGSEDIDGGWDIGTPSLPTALGATFTLGGYSGSGGDLDGILDEVRVSRVARSADWILAEHNNMSDPDGFYTIGLEEQDDTESDPLQNGWTYRKRLTIDASRVTGDLTNFLDWKEDSQAIPGHVAQTDGGDIMFTAGDGVTKLDHEIEKYEPSTGELVAWVEVRSLSGSTNTDIYIYCGTRQEFGIPTM